MLKRLALRDFVIVPSLEIEFDAGFTVLTGETGAGKSILIDALQLALGSRGDVTLVREGTPRAEVSAEFDTIPPALGPWLADGGFDTQDTLLLRRTLDAQGKSRAWINGSPATITQLREAAEQLVDIHGQHAWQSLTRPSAARALLDALAGHDPGETARRHALWKSAREALQHARARHDEIERERERLAWQIGEVERMAPADGEWDELNAEHGRLSHAQALLEAARAALDALAEAEGSALDRADRAVLALQGVTRFDARLEPVVDVLQGAQAQLQDATHTLRGYVQRDGLDGARLAELDARLAAWLSLARRFRRPPVELPALLAQWKQELRALDAATDVAALELAIAQAEQAWRDEATRLSAARSNAARQLGDAVTQAMQGLGMVGGLFQVCLLPQAEPQSFGLENVEFQVAGHAGASPRALAKVASGGELSRLALAIAVTTARAGTAAGGGAGTLIFDEIDAGIGGTVGDTVGALMKQLGQTVQVLAVTHLAQVAACGDQHWVVRKHQVDGRAESTLQRVVGESRVAEIARMLGGERLSGTAHAQALLQGAAAPSADKPPGPSKSTKATKAPSGRRARP